MKTKYLLTTAIFTLTASIALAQSVADQVVSQLQAQGFTRIEVSQGPSQVKIEAIRGNTEVEFVYDRRTGQLLSQETGRPDADDDRRPGVEYDTESRDFVVPGRSGRDDDDDDGFDDDDDDGHDDDDDDGRDDDDDDGRDDDDDDQDDDDDDGSDDRDDDDDDRDDDDDDRDDDDDDN